VSVDDLGRVTSKCQQLSDTQTEQLDGLIDRTGSDGLALANELDQRTLRRTSTPDCGVAGRISAGGAGALGSDRFHTVQRPALTIRD
jgi:hypothetical protein